MIFIDNEKRYNPIPESIQKNMEMMQNLQQSMTPIIEQQNKIYESMAPILEQQEIIQKMLPENIPTVSLEIEKPVIETLDVLPNYQFEFSALDSLVQASNSMISNMITGLTALVESSVMKEIQAISSSIGQWLQTVDFTPLINILQDIKVTGFEFDYEEVDEIFLKAMSDARWFPYAGWIADFRMVGELIDILNTSRVSKNRIKRIDALIFSYYDKEEINNFKRRWRQMNLPSYMIRILVQAVQAYHRREYALTVSALSTLWEGIIQEKAKDESFRVTKKTRENLTRLIEENEFNKIFASFCEEFIFYNCIKPEEFKPDVPGRHGIAHCWYNEYPNRKMALNAILFTDFLLELRPIEKE